MPKRSAQYKIEKYQKKIRRIEEKQRKILSPYNTSSSDEGHEGNEVTEPATAIETSIPEAAPIAQEVPADTDHTEEVNPQLENSSISDPALDPELLSALGETTSDTPEYGANIHENLAKLWLPILKRGMPKDDKEKMASENIIPENCKLLQAPKLNAEIAAAVPDRVRTRDKSLTVSQQQLGAGITAINRGIDTLLRSNDKIQAMKHLSNGCRIFCDSHYQLTQTRIKCITQNLDKSILHMINESERDETLFGSSLSEKIKAAKAIEKQGQLIKKTVKSSKSATPYNPRPSTSYQGNWSAPPRYPTSRGRGAYRRPAQSGARRPYTAAAPAQQPPPARPPYQPRAPAPPRQ